MGMCVPVSSLERFSVKYVAVPAVFAVDALTAFVAFAAFVALSAVFAVRLLIEYGALVTGCLGERVVKAPPPACLTRISKKRVAPGKPAPKSRFTEKIPPATATPLRVKVRPI